MRSIDSLTSELHDLMQRITSLRGSGFNVSADALVERYELRDRHLQRLLSEQARQAGNTRTVAVTPSDTSQSGTRARVR